MKYLRFEKHKQPRDRKTKKFTIFNLKQDDDIGVIYWHTGWRRYVSEMDGGIIVDENCHRELASFLSKLMKERKKND